MPYQQFLANFAASQEKRYSLLTCNNMFHWTNPRSREGQFSERELLLRHANNLLEDDDKSTLILGFPGEYPEAAIENLESLLQHTGFHDFYVDQVTTPQDRNFQQLVAVAKKTDFPAKDPLPGSQLNFKFSSGRIRKKLLGGKVKGKKKEKKAFSYYKLDEEKGVSRLRPFCERCGPGYFMANHGNRFTCGHCGFTRYRQNQEK